MNTNQKPKSKFVNSDSLLEQLRDMSHGVGKSLSTDFVSGMAQDALSSLFGAPKSGDLKAGQKLNLGKNDQFADDINEKYPVKPVRQTEQKHQPLFNETLQKLRQQEMLVAQKIEEIREELKALMATLKMVDSRIEKAVSEELVEPGIYHLNFLDRLKTILVLMRKNLNESASWLSVMKTRRKQRGYWSMYKKKGTEWGLNNERVVATQVG